MILIQVKQIQILDNMYNFYLLITFVAALVIKQVAFCNEALLASFNRADKGALSYMDLGMSLQILTLGEPLLAPREIAFEGLGAEVDVHVMGQSYPTLKDFLTLIPWTRVAFLLLL